MRFVPIVVLAYCALTNIVRGCIHAFAPDGGAHSIAGLDLSANGQTILSLFAEQGFRQLVNAVFQIYVLTRRRDLIVIALSLQAAETVLGVSNLFFYRALPVTVPGMPFNAALAVVLVITLIVAFTTKEKAPAR